MTDRVEEIKTKLENLFIAYTDCDVSEHGEDEIGDVQDAMPDIRWLISELEKQWRQRKWVMKELKDKQALWRNYCGEVSEQMDELEQSRAEVKRLKALLAHNGIPL